MAAPITVLDLDSLSDRPVVIIDKTAYELLTPSVLPPLDAHSLSRYAERLAELMTKDTSTVTDEEKKELAVLPGLMCALVLDAPDEVRAKLNDRQKTAIVAAFLQPPRKQTPAEDPTTLPANAPIGSTLPSAAVPSTEGIH